MFQVLSRDTTYFTARARAWAIYDAIFGDWTYGSASWMLPKIESDSISTCDATTDWTGTSLSIDAADKKEGTGSLKDDIAVPVFPPATSYQIIYNPFGSWDWSAKKHIFFWLKCDRASTAFTSARLFIYDTLVGYRYWHLIFSAGEWTAFKLLLSIGDWETTPPPDLTSIATLRIIFETADITPFYKKIDYVRVGIEEYEAMIIEPLATPQNIGQDEKGRFEFSTNYLMKIKKL